MAHHQQYFKQSEQRAKDAGFISYKNTKAFEPAYIRENLKWIHSLPLLMKQLNIYDENILEQQGYDVAAYFLYNFLDEIAWYQNKERRNYPLCFHTINYEIPDNISFQPVINE